VRWNRRTKLVLVTGGSGFVGRHVVAACPPGWEVVAPPSASLDVRSADQVADAVRGWRPGAVVHLAYRKDDPRTIVAGSANVARAAAASGARLVHVSTDVVFGGRPRPYLEQDACSPVTDYGTWKALAEREVAAADPSAVVVRTSLVYGTGELGHVQLDVERALRERAGTAFFTDEVRCPVHAGDLAAALVELSRRRDVAGPLHVAGPQPLDRAELARRFARWMGHDPGAIRTSTIAESGLVRPANVVLDTSLAASIGIRCRSLDDALG